MHPRDIARDTAKVIQNYLTYEAVKTVLGQLTETNPGEAIWLRQYSSGGKLQDGETYLEEMMSDPRGKELALRIMTVRQSIAEQVLEFLPEMVSTGIKQANLLHRRNLLERLTQVQSETATNSVDNSESELDTQEPSD
ncbi:MAG: chaperonin family protein RbcX [Pleurocapsa sp.]